MKLLLTGRAGSGKTHAILERLVPLLREGRGRDTLLLLPTQGQADHLRGVLLDRGLAAFRDDFIHTFFTLSRALAGVLPERILGEAAKDALLADLLRSESLPAFERIRDTRGFRRILGAALKELKQNGLTPRQAGSRLLAILGERAGPRHRDLARAFEAYAVRLERAACFDQEDLELRALARLEAEAGSRWGKTVLLVDGFHDFTRVQLGILKALVARCAGSTCTLSFDAENPDHPPFEVSRATRAWFLDQGFEEQFLRGNRRTGKHLARLEADLFTEAREGIPDDGSLRILRAASRESEVESIARTILRRVREEGIAWRDIAVLYHDLSPALDLLEGTFRRFGIPLRVSRSRPLEGRPIVRFLLDLGILLAQGIEPQVLLRLLRSGFLARAPLEEADRLEESIRSEGAPETPSGWLQRCRSRDLPRLGVLLDTLRRTGERLRGRHGRETLAALWIGCFEEIALPFGEAGEEDAVECAALRAFVSLFDALKGVHPKGPIPLGAMVAELREAAAVATFRFPDRRREAVNAIDAREARQWEVPHLFVAGVLEREFPPAPAEDLFLDDEDRVRLNREGFRFPDRRMRQAEEAFLFYTAVTRACSRLQISHAAADADGNPTLASFFLREVVKQVDPASLGKVLEERSSGRVLPPPEEIILPEDLDRAIYLGLGARHPRGAPPPEVALAASLYDLRRTDPEFRSGLRAALRGVRAGLLDPLLREEAARRDTAFSHSSLTDFRQCPYLHFARQWIRLKPLPERELQATDLGGILHATLRDYFAADGAVDPFDALRGHLEAAARSRQRTFRSRADGWRLRAALAALLETERQRAGSLRPKFFEVSFGMKEGEHPPLQVFVEGREERLSGRIDRVDVDAMGKLGYVVDYKYSDADVVARAFNASTAEEVAAFQLAIYLLALREVLHLEPAGAELLATRRQVRRFAVGRAALAEQWDPPKHSRRLDDGEFESYLRRAREGIIALIAAARAGDIATHPLDVKRCGAGNCPVADVCRYDPWGGGEGSPP
ncbi:MAG TPA: PD-(D/E)XK nuclease family protein [Candidatus Polarisedimenticolia bacterium]|nr:PD-(D/E)XK nuclease family protein [Candidatus Polarisedimenticolia bacterium]